VAISPTALNELYQPLETACGDVRRYTFISAALGCLIIVTAALAATVSSVFLALIAFAYFPFATAFLLSQHLLGLRLLRAEYAVATAVRRREIITKIRQYQEMMLAGGITAPVIGVVRALRLNRPSAESGVRNVG
jgi:hypothetical protein